MNNNFFSIYLYYNEDEKRKSRQTPKMWIFFDEIRTFAEERFYRGRCEWNKNIAKSFIEGLFLGAAFHLSKISGFAGNFFKSVEE